MFIKCSLYADHPISVWINPQRVKSFGPYLSSGFWVEWIGEDPTRDYFFGTPEQFAAAIDAATSSQRCQVLGV